MDSNNRNYLKIINFIRLNSMYLKESNLGTKMTVSITYCFVLPNNPKPSSPTTHPLSQHNSCNIIIYFIGLGVKVNNLTLVNKEVVLSQIRLNNHSRCTNCTSDRSDFGNNWTTTFYSEVRKHKFTNKDLDFFLGTNRERREAMKMLFENSQIKCLLKAACSKFTIAITILGSSPSSDRSTNQWQTLSKF